MVKEVCEAIPFWAKGLIGTSPSREQVVEAYSDLLNANYDMNFGSVEWQNMWIDSVHEKLNEGSYKVQHVANVSLSNPGHVYVTCAGFKTGSVSFSDWNCRTGEHGLPIEKAELTFFGTESGYFEVSVRTAPYMKQDGPGKPYQVGPKLLTKGGVLKPLEHTCEEPFYGVWRAE